MNKKIYFIILACISLAAAFTSGIFSPYFKEVFEITAKQRGFIEIPRETPGILIVIIIALLGSMSDIKIKIIAQVLCIVSSILLGITSPTYNVMLIILFTFSLGQHIYFSVGQSLDLSFIEDNSTKSKQVGIFKGYRLIFTMLGTAVIFIGFKYKFFSFNSDIILPFIIGSVLFSFALILLIILNFTHKVEKKERRFNFVFKKKYSLYYFLVTLHGVQKQIMLVYGPWIILELFGKSTDCK